jgi:general secretion pathway protein F
VSRTFRYVALDAAGEKRRGTLAAGSLHAAANLLRARQLAPLSLREAWASPWAGAQAPPLKGAQLAELLFSLGRLLRGGANLRGALSVISGADAPSRQRETCLKLQEMVGAGHSLAEAFERVLGGGAVAAFVAAGERAGELGPALDAASNLIRRDLELRSKIVAALSYPAFITVAFVGALAMLIFVVAPSIAPLLSEVGGSPPMILRVLVAVQATMASYGAGLAFVAAALFSALLLAARAGLFAAACDRAVLDGPLRSLSRRLLYGQAASVIGRLMAAGAPAPEALRLGSAVMANGLARQRLERAAAAIFAGSTLSSSLALCEGFPPEVLRMATLGEGAGELGPMLMNAGELAQANALQNLERLSKWLAPSLIVALGALIGMMMASLLGALNSLGSAALN